MNLNKKLVIIGGGAAGFFAAITAASQNPNLSVTILEQGNDVLGKVKISGGGRCNVTHACFDIEELVKFYPRGSKELVALFYRFNCNNTIDWFETRNVQLKTEDDGRIFPVSNQSQTIIDCLIEQAKAFNIQVVKQAKVMRFEVEDKFSIFYNDIIISADFLLIATGSNNTIWQHLNKMGHTIIAPVPSLFTFNIKHQILKDLAGITLANVRCSLKGTKIISYGSILITHTGLSGPAILKLSAFAARILNEMNYHFELELNWINLSTEEAIEHLKNEKNNQSKRQVNNFSPFDIPNRFWLRIIAIAGISNDKLVADLSKNDMQNIANLLTQNKLYVFSKNTNKDEFVTAGGIALKEVNFKTMESKKIPNLYFAGEVLNIDAVTGGFNFQAAWTTGFIAGSSISSTI